MGKRGIGRKDKGMKGGGGKETHARGGRSVGEEEGGGKGRGEKGRGGRAGGGERWEGGVPREGSKVNKDIRAKARVGTTPVLIKPNSPQTHQLGLNLKNNML